MNEQACAFVCAIFSAICMLMSGYAMETGDSNFVVLSLISAVVVVAISGFVLLSRYF